MKRLGKVELYSGVGSVLATSDFTTQLHLPNGYANVPILYVEAIGGTGTATIVAAGSPNPTPDAADFDAVNRYLMAEVAEAANAESKDVVTAAAPGEKVSFMFLRKGNRGHGSRRGFV